MGVTACNTLRTGFKHASMSWLSCFKPGLAEADQHVPNSTQSQPQQPTRNPHAVATVATHETGSGDGSPKVEQPAPALRSSTDQSQPSKARPSLTWNAEQVPPLPAAERVAPAQTQLAARNLPASARPSTDHTSRSDAWLGTMHSLTPSSMNACIVPGAHELILMSEVCGCVAAAMLLAYIVTHALACADPSTCAPCHSCHCMGSLMAQGRHAGKTGIPLHIA